LMPSIAASRTRTTSAFQSVSRRRIRANIATPYSPKR
jgi:hypothetical protein